MEATTSTPSFSSFDPSIIPFQDKVVDDVLCFYNYGLGTHEVLLSGSVGSAKSILGAHLAVRHCFEFPGARFLLARKALPQLRETIYTKVVEHLQQDSLKEGKHYFLNDTQCQVRFSNGSEIISTTWADKKYSKVRSYEISSAFIEEGTENNDDDQQAYTEIFMRCGRLPHIPHKWLMVATNPDSPSHWLYKRFFVEKKETRHVYLSKTEDNPFLPPEYIQGLKENMDPKMARRMLHGEWLDIRGETVYHQYGDEHEISEEYKLSLFHPIYFTWDFNIGDGKPLSVTFYQLINGHFHFFDEIVIEGARTETALEEAADRGLFEPDTTFYCQGDASGKHRDTRSNLSDYEIIDRFMLKFITKDNRRLRYQRQVPVSNPPVRTRHNVVNSYLKNDLGKVRISIYPKCKTLREGFRLTKLKKGADYQEDDSKFYQHITTAAGYGICWHHINENKPRTTQRDA